MKKQAVAYINYRIINLLSDTSILVQRRYATIKHFTATIELLKSKKTRKMALGLEGQNVLVEIEDICVLKEYARYMKEVYGDEDLDFKSGKRVLALLKQDITFDEIVGEGLCVEKIESNVALNKERKAVKNQFDAKARIFKQGVNHSCDSELAIIQIGKRLQKVVDYARKNNLSFDESSYENIHKDMEWKCNKCKSDFVVNFKRLKDRKTACKSCARKESINNSGIKTIQDYAKKVNLRVDCTGYKKELGYINRLFWTCSHGKSEVVSVQAMKRRTRARDECPICRYK